MNDIRSGEIAAGVQWGPIAAYWAARDGEKLVVVPLLKETGAGKIAFRITMGVRKATMPGSGSLNEVIRKRQGDIDKVLLDYGVPLLVDDDTSMEMITKPRTSDALEPGSATPTTAASTTGPAAPPALRSLSGDSIRERAFSGALVRVALLRRTIGKIVPRRSGGGAVAMGLSFRKWLHQVASAAALAIALGYPGHQFRCRSLPSRKQSPPRCDRGPSLSDWLDAPAEPQTTIGPTIIASPFR